MPAKQLKMSLLQVFFEMTTQRNGFEQNSCAADQVHIRNFGGGVAGSEDFACATLPATPLDFQGKIKNFCHPTLLRIRFKITVTPLQIMGKVNKL